MPAKIIAAELAQLSERSPLLENLRRFLRALAGLFARSASAADRALVVEDRVAIGPKKMLVVVCCHGQRFLIATAGDTIGPLVEITPPRPVRNSVRRARKESGV